MLRQKKVEKIMQILDELYPETPIPLLHQSPYQLLVAVLMSAQTTDKKVNEVTPKLFEAAPNAELMALLDIDFIQDTIREIGLAPTKSKNIQKLSQILAEKYNGEVPQSFEELESLPGVGHKTASVVMAQAFGEDAFPVDTHIHRLADRWGLSTGANVVKTEKDLKKAFPKNKWNRLHLQIIFFGREHCPAKWHDMEKCPICSWASGKRRKEKLSRPKNRSRTLKDKSSK